jgi:hypothetical protein
MQYLYTSTVVDFVVFPCWPRLFYCIWIATELRHLGFFFCYREKPVGNIVRVCKTVGGWHLIIFALNKRSNPFVSHFFYYLLWHLVKDWCWLGRTDVHIYWFMSLTGSEMLQQKRKIKIRNWYCISWRGAFWSRNFTVLKVWQWWVIISFCNLHHVYDKVTLNVIVALVLLTNITFIAVSPMSAGYSHATSLFWWGWKNVTITVV